MKPKMSTEERFWDKVEMIPFHSCWEWNACKNSWGYGHFRFKKRSIHAHRASWMMHFGNIPKKILVCHKCDNPGCVRPNHLFLGTNADNKRDCVLKGRAYKGGIPPRMYGRGHPNSKLTEEQVKEIRAKYTGKYGNRIALAREYGIDPSNVGLIVQRKNWKWLK